MVIGDIVQESKQQLKVWLPGSVIRMLKHEIALSRGTISKGILSSEVENAINERIVVLRKRRSNIQQTTRQQQNAQELDDLLKLRDSIIDYMTSQTRIWPEGPRQHIAEGNLIEAIAWIKGVVDPRTIKKWKTRLSRANLIRIAGPKLYIFCDLDIPTPTLPELEQPQAKAVSDDEIASLVNAVKERQRQQQQQQGVSA